MEIIVIICITLVCISCIYIGLYNSFMRCWHEWKIKDEYDIVSNHRKVGYITIYRCVNCKEHKKSTVKFK